MEPVRVKLYGLFWRTRTRYLIDSGIGLAVLGAMVIGWFSCWPPLKDKLEVIEHHQIQAGKPPLPPYMQITIAVLNVLPIILGATALYKGMEMYFVLQNFARKEAESKKAAVGRQNGLPLSNPG
jgi:hypothetical protein